MKKRNDATYVGDLIPYKRIFPYVMPKRTDSVVYHQFSLDITRGLQFLKDLNKNHPIDHKVRVFELFIAALMRTFVLRPHLNRFLMNYDCWQRNDLSVNFVVKEDYTDEAPEHSAIIYFDPSMTLTEMAAKINSTIEESRTGGRDNDTDSAIEFFLHFPKLVLRFLIMCMRTLDRWGIAPKALRDADGLHASAFIANLGSINLPGNLHHHLYEWGTTSVFITMGMLQRKRIVDAEGRKSHIDTIEVGVTVDERITDGFYFIKSISVLQDHLRYPEKLMERPVIPPPNPTLKEIRKRKREQKRLKRKEKRIA